MGLRVAGWWPCFMDTANLMPEPRRFDIDDPFDWNGSREIRTEPDPWNARVSWMEPLLYVPCGPRGYLMHVPAYTTDARETERVMALLVQKGHHLKGIHSPSATTVTVFLRQAGEDVSAVTAKHADWKRAVCEAALLAVRGAR